MKHWVRSAFTDNAGEFDIGQIVTPVVLFWLMAIESWAVAINKQSFDPQSLGIGVGAILAALGAYKWGDSKSPEPK